MIISQLNQTKTKHISLNCQTSCLVIYINIFFLKKLIKTHGCLCVHIQLKLSCFPFVILINSIRSLNVSSICLSMLMDIFLLKFVFLRWQKTIFNLKKLIINNTENNHDFGSDTTTKMEKYFCLSTHQPQNAE